MGRKYLAIVSVRGRKPISEIYQRCQIGQLSCTICFLCSRIAIWWHIARGKRCEKDWANGPRFIVATKTESERLRDRESLTTRNNIALLDLLQEAGEHGLHVEAAVVSETVLVQIGLQIVTANRVINAFDSVFDQRPKSFDCLGMHFASNVNLFTMTNPAVIKVVPRSRESVVCNVVIGENEVRWHDVLFNQPVQSVFLCVGSNECANATLALHQSDNRSLGFLVQSGCTALMTTLATAVVRLIHFYRLSASAEPRAILRFVQHGANLLKHAPCRLVRHPSLALNLFGANPASSLGHEIDGIEPSRERSRRLVEDRSRGRVNVMAATVARVRRATHDAMMLSGRFALFAIDALRVEAIAKPLKAGRVIWELLLEVFQCVRQHVRLAVVMGHLVTYCQVKSYQMTVPTVKG